MRALINQFVTIVALGVVVLLFIVLLPFMAPSLASSLGEGIATFFHGLWIALIIVFFFALVIGGVVAYVKIRHMDTTQIIIDKDGQPVRAIVHQGQLVQLAPAGLDIQEVLQLQQQQALHLQQYWKMIGSATTSMKQMTAFMEQYAVDDDDDEDGVVDGQIDTTPANRQLPVGQGGPVVKLEQQLASILGAFQIHAYVEPSATQIGPRIIQLGVVPLEVEGRRTRIEEITKREKDIQLALGAKSIRILSPVPGTHHVGIEIPNPAPIPVTIADVLESSEYQEACATSKLVVVLGRDVTGRVRFCDIEKAPHILIGGSTNAGKSVLINVMIASLLTQATPDEVRLLMVDPKQVELTPYNGIAHLLTPVVTDMTRVVSMLKRVIKEMERRYQIFVSLGVRKLSEYRNLHQPGLENLPAWVIIFDEFADLMMTAPTETEEMVIRLAQKARATGIHLIIATQKPVVEVVTSLIKGNLPTTIALKTKTASDSRVVLDQGGAERLLGNGDMLYLAADSEEAIRIQGAYMTNDHIQSVIASARKKSVSTNPYPDELIGNVETGGNGSGNSLETASEASGNIIEGVFTDASPVTEELTENAPVSREIRETIKRLAAMPNMPHRKIAGVVGLGGRKYPIYQQVCKEEGIVIKQSEEA